MKPLHFVPSYDIAITLDGNNWGTITSVKSGIKPDFTTSSLKGDDEVYNAAIDGLESIILAHACAGINVSDPAYLEGIETAVDAITNCYA